MKPFETRHDQRVKLCLVRLNISECFLFGSRELCGPYAAVSYGGAKFDNFSINHELKKSIKH